MVQNWHKGDTQTPQILYIWVFFDLLHSITIFTLPRMGGFRHRPILTASALFSRCVASRLASSIYCMYRSRTKQQTRDRVSNIWVIFVYIIYITFFTHIYGLRNGIIYFTVKNSVGDIWREREKTCKFSRRFTHITCRSLQGGSIWTRCHAL